MKKTILRISITGREAHLYETTVGDNFTFGRQDSVLGKVVKATREGDGLILSVECKDGGALGKWMKSQFRYLSAS